MLKKLLYSADTIPPPSPFEVIVVEDVGNPPF